MIKVKICCIKSIAEAKLAIETGATAVGLVAKMPSGPGIIDDALIRQIANAVPPSISSFLLTSETSAKSIIDHSNRTNTSTIQIVDRLQTGSYEDIRTGLPNTELVQVIHVIGKESIDEAIAVSPYVDYILLDSGNPNLEVKKLGGTGKVHNWEISATIRKEVDVPIYLAGGLNCENVGEAIGVVKPYGLDVCSGVRANGKLSKEKVEAFFKAIKQAGDNANN